MANAVYEVFGGANMAWSSYPGMSHATYVNVAANGSEEQKALYLPKIASGQWAGTMCLTEPNAGTDLGLMRTRAVAQPDGSYCITGSKIFISGGEQDLTDNIMHLVLARISDAPPGVKGISLSSCPSSFPMRTARRAHATGWSAAPSSTSWASTETRPAPSTSTARPAGFWAHPTKGWRACSCR
ncbi:acyl-CoA dehydrogenase family protein [Variovorax sp. S12S4]|uniref:acyl-CoA dehydrogenase family protein n=1 Tax=Variovorax sp. S12S4 TaxID=3029170 RepID=UPI00406D2746